MADRFTVLLRFCCAYTCRVFPHSSSSSFQEDNPHLEGERRALLGFCGAGPQEAWHSLHFVWICVLYCLSSLPHSGKKAARCTVLYHSLRLYLAVIIIKEEGRRKVIALWSIVVQYSGEPYFSLLFGGRRRREGGEGGRGPGSHRGC